MKTLSGLVATLAAAPVFAQDLPVIGRPVDGATGFQPAATGIARDLHWLDNFVLVIITVIVAFVTTLMVYSFLRFNRRANPKPATFTHNTPLEMIWTAVPILILVVIGAFS
ncbi:MAG: cytochrome c oxidase subunit II, partial [Gemmobacter sp.]|nr:cytochrome c oxidase subunit II [Gemmobacter sp.]